MESENEIHSKFLLSPFQFADIVLWLEPALLFLDLATAEHEIPLGHILGECVVCHLGA